MHVACRSCGNVMDLDFVPSKPGKHCSDCNAALDETALEAVSFITREARAQAVAEVAAIGVEAATAPGDVAERVAALESSNLSSRLASLEASSLPARVATLETSVVPRLEALETRVPA